MNLTRIIVRWSIVLLALAVLACSTLQTLTQQSTPREKYLVGLGKSHLDQTAMVKHWLDAGDVTKHDSIMVSLPFQETGFMASSEPQARFYRFDVKDGQILTLTCVKKTKENARLFIDVFMREQDSWQPVAHADSLALTYEVKKNGSCLVRLQPELLVNLYYSITISVTPVLLNPVKGASNKSIGSFYGDPRDDGKRKHEGIDIFAPKGTFVVAPADGVISSVSTSKLGGKTIWMNDLKRGHSYYFAHLDSQIVKAGKKVRQGDVLGTVGNTGNARTTPSHLHFGVYQHSSKDPIAYIRTMEKLVNELAPDTLFQSLAFRVSKKSGTMRTGPNIKLPLRQPLAKDAYVKVIAQSTQWYRVVTAAGDEGFIEKTSITPAERGSKLILKRPSLLLSEATTDAVPITTLSGGVENLASHKNYRYVKTPDGVTGWIDLSKM